MTETSSDVPQLGITIHIDEEQRIAIVSLTGQVSPRGVARARQLLTSNALFRSDMNRLWDMRRAELSKSTRTEFERTAQAEGAGTMGGRFAVLVATELDFGMARLFQMVEAEDFLATMRVFRDRDDALAWLTEAVG